MILDWEVDVQFLSDPSHIVCNTSTYHHAVMTHPVQGESVFAREIGQLKAAGYAFDSDDPRKMVPPGGCT